MKKHRIIKAFWTLRLVATLNSFLFLEDLLSSSLCLYYSNSMSKTSRYNGTYAKDDGAKLKVYFQIEKALKMMLICCFEGA